MKRIRKDEQIKKFRKYFKTKLEDEFFRRILIDRREGRFEEKGFWMYSRNNSRKAYQRKLLEQILAEFEKEKQDSVLIDKKSELDKNINENIGFENAELDNLNKSSVEKRQSNSFAFPRNDQLKGLSNKALEEIQESKESVRNELYENQIEKELDVLMNEEKEEIEFEVIEKLKMKMFLI